MNERKRYIDNIRWATVLLVVIYHVIYLFNSSGVISNISVKGIPQLDAFLCFVYPWFMDLLFAAAGMSAKYALDKRSPKEFAADRAKRLLVPAICGIFLLGWVIGWVTNQYIPMFPEDFEQVPSPVRQIIRYIVYTFSGMGPLWFAIELFIASMVLLLIRKIDGKGKFYELCGKTNIIVLVLLVFAVWGSANILNTPLVEVFRNGIYIFMFLLGYYVFSHENVTDILVKYKLPLLIAAAVLGIAYTVYYFGENYTSHTVLDGFFTNAYAWMAILAVIGCSKAWFNADNKFTRYMAKNSFAYYALHYPIMVLLAYFITTYITAPAGVYYLLLFIAEAAVLPLIVFAVGKVPVLRTLLLGRK